MIGYAIGTLVGIISGTVFLLLLNAAVNPQKKGNPPILKLSASFLAMPPFWFGSPWLTSTFLQPVDPGDLVNSYAISLAITFGAIAAYPGLRWIIKVGEELGKGGK
jgi:hypothetical protein